MEFGISALQWESGLTFKGGHIRFVNIYQYSSSLPSGEIVLAHFQGFEFYARLILPWCALRSVPVILQARDYKGTRLDSGLWIQSKTLCP